ncbi:unnamed protein product [Symbiodinium sp. CCMP2592]|nr:unnamed protein product [Symbiodinium sp. CCMP2592]
MGSVQSSAGGDEVAPPPLKKLKTGGKEVSPPPKVLEVKSPHSFLECDGVYDLLAWKANGQHIWKQRGGERWLYFNNVGRWTVGDEEELKNNFDCTDGYIRHRQKDWKLSPDKMPAGEWEYTPDGCGWQHDPRIVVETPKSFSGTNYKKKYKDAQAATDKYEFAQIFFNFLDMIAEEGQKISKHEIKDMKNEVMSKARDFGDMSKLATYVWTLATPLGGREVCSYINEIIREDQEYKVKTLLPLVRTINELLVQEVLVKAPKNHTTYRGSRIPHDSLKFFQAKRQYRVNMFLATSDDKRKAQEFAEGAEGTEVPTLFHVHWHKDNGCIHVNYLEHITAVKSEREYLFPPYSTFTVMQMAKKQGRFYVIHIFAEPDNKSCSEELPLSSWH